MRPFVVSVLLLALSATRAVNAGVIGGAVLSGGGGDHYGGYGMSDDIHSGGHFSGAELAFDGGHSFHNDIVESSGEQFSGDYGHGGGGHAGFEYGGFDDSMMSAHEDNAALSAVGLANLLTGGGIGGAHSHLASSGGSSYTISGPTQEIKSIHKITTTSSGGHVISKTKGAAAQPQKIILVKNDAYSGGHGGSEGLSGGHGGLSSAHLEDHVAYSHGGHGGHGGHVGHAEISASHEEIGGGHAVASGGHALIAHSGHGGLAESNSLGYGAAYGGGKANSGWH